LRKKRTVADPEPTTPLDLSSLPGPIRVAACLERYPIVLPPPTRFDKLYEHFKFVLDAQNSIYGYEEQMMDKELAAQAAAEAAASGKKAKKAKAKHGDPIVSYTT
jgi:hypothetical protein